VWPAPAAARLSHPPACGRMGWHQPQSRSVAGLLVPAVKE
jgi:hypothetical protein